jgi:hypothetical protein
MKIFHAAFAVLLITGSMLVQPAYAQSKPQDLIARAAPTHVWKIALFAVLPIDGKGHPSRMSIGASAR